MTIPAPLTDHQILDRLAPLLREAHEHGGHIRDQAPADDTLSIPADLTRRVRYVLDQARERGIAHRQIASYSRVPGRWLVGWYRQPTERATAYVGEIHHLERELAALRLDRARDAAALRNPRQYPGRPKVGGMTKVALAETFKVSRPTIDDWLRDATIAREQG